MANTVTTSNTKDTDVKIDKYPILTDGAKQEIIFTYKEKEEVLEEYNQDIIKLYELEMKIDKYYTLVEAKLRKLNVATEKESEQIKYELEEARKVCESLNKDLKQLEAKLDENRKKLLEQW